MGEIKSRQPGGNVHRGIEQLEGGAGRPRELTPPADPLESEILDSMSSITADELVVSNEPDQSDFPPEFRQPVYGQHPTEELRLGELVHQLGQSRERDNPISAPLTRSIGRIGLLNNVTTGRLSEDEFRYYVAFSNRIWGKNVRAEDLPIADDGGRRLVIAGHTRTRSMIADAFAQAELARQAGYHLDPMDARTVVKSYSSPSPELIVALQTDENIHREVPKERQAMGTVETYYYGLENGLWVDEKTFLEEMSGKYSPELLRDAMHFASLPEFAREQVFIGSLPYSVAIEASKTYRDYIRYQLFKNYEGRAVTELKPDELAELDRETFDWLNIAVANLHRKKLTQKGRIGIATKQLAAFRAGWNEEIERYARRVAAAEHAEQPDLFTQEWNVKPDTDFNKNNQDRTKEIRRLLGGLAVEPLEQLRQAIRLQHEAAERTNGHYTEIFDEDEVLERVVAMVGDTPIVGDVQMVIAEVLRAIPN